MNRKRLYEHIERQGEALNAIFSTQYSNVQLCKKLLPLEVETHALAVNYRNGTAGVDCQVWERRTTEILKKVRKILNCTDTFPIFANGDARGYALKIDSEYMFNCRDLNGYRQLHKDRGGYGILAPDFREFLKKDGGMR